MLVKNGSDQSNLFIDDSNRPTSVGSIPTWRCRIRYRNMTEHDAFTSLYLYDHFNLKVPSSAPTPIKFANDTCNRPLASFNVVPCVHD